MNVTDILDTVKATVLRPNLSAEIEARVLAAITTVHGVANFIRDRYEESIVMATPAAIGTVELPREMHRIEAVIPAFGGILMEPLQLVSPSELMKRRRLRTDLNTAYVNGGALSFKCAAAPDELVFIGYRKQLPASVLNLPTGGKRLITDPVLADATTWLMEDYPIAIIDLAMGQLEALMGNGELASIRMQTWQVEHKPYLFSISTGSAGH